MPITNFEGFDYFPVHFDGSQVRPGEKIRCEPDLEKDKSDVQETLPPDGVIFLRKQPDFPLMLKLVSGEVTLEALKPFLSVKSRASVLKIVRKHYKQLERQFKEKHPN